MIENELQYRITKQQSQLLEDGIRALEIRMGQKSGSTLELAELNGLRSQLRDLHRELFEYLNRESA